MCSGERLSQLGNERADRIATAFLLSKDVMKATKKTMRNVQMKVKIMLSDTVAWIFCLNHIVFFCFALFLGAFCV